MNTLSTNFDTDNSELATWNRPRSTEELRSFVDARHALIPDSVSIE